MADNKLTPKQELFCQEYMIDSNATQAYKRAGYSANSDEVAGVEGHKLLKNPKIHARIEELRTERSKRTEITADFVLYGLKEVAERCLTRIPVMEFDYENKCMSQKRDDQGNGVWEFDSSGANKSFELLGKHLGIFEKDNSQKAPAININALGVDDLNTLVEMQKKIAP